MGKQQSRYVVSLNLPALTITSVCCVSINLLAHRPAHRRSLCDDILSTLEKYQDRGLHEGAFEYTLFMTGTNFWHKIFLSSRAHFSGSHRGMNLRRFVPSTSTMLHISKGRRWTLYMIRNIVTKFHQHCTTLFFIFSPLRGGPLFFFYDTSRLWHGLCSM